MYCPSLPDATVIGKKPHKFLSVTLNNSATLDQPSFFKGVKYFTFSSYNGTTLNQIINFKTFR